MTNWQEIVNGIETPKGLSLSEWVALEGPNSKEEPVALGSPIETFLEKYQISKLGSSQVALTLPGGISRIGFLKEAQELSIALHASNPEEYRAENAVRSQLLKIWELEPKLTGVTKKALALRVDGNVMTSTRYVREEPEDNFWCDVTREDLAVAHTAFYLLTGKSLFEGSIVRAAGGALQFSLGGLAVIHYDYDTCRFNNVSTTRSLPAPA